ncbi:MAG: hypothetical protein P8Y70_05560 [Candidatus Lokiarchaeota archaeon]
MLELISYNEEVLNTKEKVTIDLIRDGENFLEQFESNQKLLLNTVSIIHKYLRMIKKIPYNLFKYYIAAYYIVTRHPLAFPVHEPKKDFCQKFGIKISALDYCVDKLTKTLHFIKILDDLNYPYFIDPYKDIGYKLAKSIVEDEVENAMMNFLLKHQQINPQILSEELATRLIFEMEVFPEELFRQFFEIINEIIDENLQEFYEYEKLQTKYLI